MLDAAGLFGAPAQGKVLTARAFVSQPRQLRAPTRNVTIDLCGDGVIRPGRSIAASAVASPETSARNSASRRQRWTDNVEGSSSNAPGQPGFQNQQAAWTPRLNPQEPEYGQPAVSNGWGISPTAEDDSGWGSPEPMMDWGSSSPEASARPNPDDWPGGPAGAQPGQSGCNGFSNQQWEAAGAGSQGQQWQQPGSDGFQPPPGMGDPYPGAGQDPDSSSQQQWDFFADGYQAPRSGRWGPDPRFSGAGRAQSFNQPPQEPVNAPWPASDITHLSRSEMEALLPVTPTGKQAEYYQPRNLSERLVQLLTSLGATVVLSKSTALAAPALLFPIWSPWIRAGLRNIEVYTRSLKCLGLWRAQVLEVELVGSSRGFQSGPWGRGGSSMSNLLVQVLIGDPWPGGARVQMEFPWQPKAELLQAGESVEALVLAKDEGFQSFKVIREVYAPGLSLWLAEYPFVDRSAFLDISLQIERQRQAGWGEDPASSPGGDHATGETAWSGNGFGQPHAADPGTQQGSWSEEGHAAAALHPIVDVDPLFPSQQSWGGAQAGTPADQGPAAGKGPPVWGDNVVDGTLGSASLQDSPQVPGVSQSQTSPKLSRAGRDLLDNGDL